MMLHLCRFSKVTLCSLSFLELLGAVLLFVFTPCCSWGSRGPSQFLDCNFLWSSISNRKQSGTSAQADLSNTLCDTRTLSWAIGLRLAVAILTHFSGEEWTICSLCWNYLWTDVYLQRMDFSWSVPPFWECCKELYSLMLLSKYKNEFKLVITGRRVWYTCRVTGFTNYLSVTYYILTSLENTTPMPDTVKVQLSLVVFS